MPLFNGKDLTGLEGLADRWTLKDGAIVGSTPQDGLKFNSFLCSKNKYKDFELKFQVKLTGTGREGNSGVQIRSELKDKDQFVVWGPQCDIGQQYWPASGEKFANGKEATKGGMMKAAVPTSSRGPRTRRVRRITTSRWSAST